MDRPGHIRGLAVGLDIVYPEDPDTRHHPKCSGGTGGAEKFLGLGLRTDRSHKPLAAGP